RGGQPVTRVICVTAGVTQWVSPLGQATQRIILEGGDVRHCVLDGQHVVGRIVSHGGDAVPGIRRLYLAVQGVVLVARRVAQAVRRDGEVVRRIVGQGRGSLQARDTVGIDLLGGAVQR